VGRDQADEVCRAPLAARDPSPHWCSSRHDPEGAGLAGPPSYGPRAARISKLDPFRGAVEELLDDEPTLSGVRIREELEKLGYRRSPG
jgi:hypothetical protein